MFRAMFDGRASPVSGPRARKTYEQQRPSAIVVLSQPSRRWTPHDSASPFPFALLLTLRGGPPPALGPYRLLEPCVVASDFAWAMVHTHEDEALGGPYYIEAERLRGPFPPPPRRRRWR